jgi:hypothetical protein
MIQGKRIASTALIALAVATQVAPAAQAARHRYYYTRPSTRVMVEREPTFFERHPMLKSTVVGGALGTGIGAIGGAIAGHHRAGRGALFGLGSGAGIGAVEGSTWGHRHPIMKETATGSLLGLGVGGTMGRHRALKGAGIGALLGGGLGLLRHSNGYY